MKSSASSEHISPRQTSSPRKHIVFIHYYFPPMGGGGVQRLTKFLKYFDYEKYDVTVLTVKSSFFYSSDPSLLKEIPAQVRVLRSGSLDPFRLLHFYQMIRNKLKFLPESLSSARGVSQTKKNENAAFHAESTDRIRRLSMSFFVPDSRILWLPFAFTKLWQLNRINPIDLIVASMPPFTSGLIGILFQQWMKIPAVLDFRDAWTNNPYLPEMGSINKSLNEHMERFSVERAAGIIFVNPMLRKYYERKYTGLSNKPLSTIRNGFDPDDFNSLPGSDKGKALPFTIGIMGTIYSQGNRPISLLKALNELFNEKPEFRQTFKLVFLGKWSPDFLELIEQYEIGESIELIGYLPHREALKRAAEFDALSLTIESDFSGSELVTPGRVYEYLRLQKPILALCPPESDLAFLVRDHQAGEAIAFENVAEIKSVVLGWIENRSSFSDKYKFSHIEKINRCHLTKELLEFIKDFNSEEK